MQVFSADAVVFSKKTFKVFAPQNMKKQPSEVVHNRPTIFFSVLAWLPKRPKDRNTAPPNAR